MQSLNIRPEEPQDVAAIRAVNEAAFGRPAEADLVDALRQSGRVTLSLVAEEEGRVVGHILFFPLSIQGESGSHAALGLGPMAVLPERQRAGVGSALVSAGLFSLQTGEHPGIIVLGHPEYYPRFGFVPASRFGITTDYEVPDEVFMATELVPGALSGVKGRVVYPSEFEGV